MATKKPAAKSKRGPSKSASKKAAASPAKAQPAVRREATPARATSARAARAASVGVARQQQQAAEAAPNGNGKKRIFIQLDVPRQVRDDVNAWLYDKGFTARKVRISDIGRVIFRTLVAGRAVNIQTPGDYFAALAELER